MVAWPPVSSAAGQDVRVPGKDATQRRSPRLARAMELRRAASSRLTEARPSPNGDEARFGASAAFTKCLPHDTAGRVDPESYRGYLAALRSGSVDDFDRIRLGGVIKLANPRAAYAFALDGPETTQLACPPFPSLTSDALAAEALELYWQALTRDVAFEDYGADPLIAEACRELGASPLSSAYGGDVTPAVVFRGGRSGDRVGPYVSQFLWKEVPYGAIRLVPHVRTATPGFDYMVTWDDWSYVQNGGATVSRHASAYRYIRSARDLAAYTNLDFTYQAFLSAALILFGMEGTTDVRRPYKGAPYDTTNPYRGSPTQSGFVTGGVATVLDLVARVAHHALRVTWAEKWLVHRALRPEEYGALVHQQVDGNGVVRLPTLIVESAAVGHVRQRHRTALLPQAYPEGSPMHPAYPSGHAAIAGACCTVLKALFDEGFPIDRPVLARPDGLSLAPYTGPELTVGGELDKLASNLSYGRNAAGIHWRSDAEAGLRLGEAVALQVLRETEGCVPEGPLRGSFTNFDGVPTQV